MKSVVACTPLNSIFTGFNHRPQWFQADTTARSIRTRICCVTRCSQRSGLASTSKASLKSYSQFPGSWQQQQVPRPPPFSSLHMIHARIWSRVAAVHPPSASRGERQGTQLPPCFTSNAATCITSGWKLCLLLWRH